MIETWSKGVADECMPEEMLVSTMKQVERHPWWRARAALALSILKRQRLLPPARVFDVGCGWGINLTALERAGYRATGLDISAQILHLIERRGRHLIEADITQPLPAGLERADALFALDVIEHIDDDRAAVQALARMLRPGGCAVLSVPALPELFSEFDQIQGHRRRYVPASLREVFRGTGFETPAIFWWGSWMVPILRRMRSRPGADAKRAPRGYADYLALPAWPGPQLMSLAFTIEKRLALAGKLKVGTSLFAVASRSAEEVDRGTG